MSRIDKRIHQEQVVGTAKDSTVRLFAFANSRPGYQVCFSPEAPIIVLKTKKPAVEQHPCKQWEPFSSIVFNARPNTTHAVYVADTTALSGPQFEQEEYINGAAVGPLMKRLSNLITKLNPHNGTLVAAGVSTHLALKYMLAGEKILGHRDRLLQKVILVCPPSLQSLKSLGAAVQQRKLHETGYPLPDVVVLLNEASQIPEWEAWHRELEASGQIFASFTVTADLTPSLFAAVARSAGVTADGTTVETGQRYSTPRVFRIDFVLSKQTKNVEQIPSLSPLDTLGYEDDTVEETFTDDDDEDEESDYESEADHDAPHQECGAGCDADHHHHHHHDGGACDSCDGEEAEEEESMLVSGISGLQHWKDPVRVMTEGRVLDLAKGLVGTTEGRVIVEGLKEIIEEDKSLSKHASKKGAPIALATALVRDEDGFQRLRAVEVSALTRAQEKRSMTVGGTIGEIPAYNVSAVQHHYGALLIRGRKCALVRDLSGQRDGLFVPYLPHSEVGETSLECATRALCEGCQVSSDNFYVPNYLPPVVFYERVTGEDGNVLRCVTLYCVLAVSPPPRGPASDAVEDAPEPEEPYDWVSFSKAMSVLSASEGEAIQCMQQSLRKAATVGLYKPFTGCGLFGDAVDSSSCTAPINFEGLEILTVLCPGDHSHELIPSIKHAMHSADVIVFNGTSTRATIESAAATALHSTLVVYLDSSEVDVDTYCNDHLMYFTEERGVRARFFTVLLPAVAAALTDLNAEAGAHGATMDALMSGARISDALITLEPTELLSDNSWAILQCLADASSDLGFFYGLDTQQPINFSDRRPDPNGSLPQLMRVDMPEKLRSTPVAPAALSFLTNPGSLDVFYESGASKLMAVSGDVWISTRQESNAFVYLDGASRCLCVEEGEPWEGSTANTGRQSELSLWIWCVAKASEKVKQTATALMEQLLWNAERDGADQRKVKDPLPSWE